MDNYLVNQSGTSGRASALKTYYARYLQVVRGLTESSVRHYLDALNNISRRLASKQLVHEDIYEIMNLEYLETARDILYSDPEFIELNERGKRMYSAGLNNYIRFASGEDYSSLFGEIEKMDIPLPAEEPIIVEQTVWKRSNVLRIQALVCADFKCELDNCHQTFIAEKSGKPYMESHHVIPMRQQPHFKNSLDVYANIVCLCPICHRKIHFGLKSERVNMIQQIYRNRATRLEKSGLCLSVDEFVELADCVHG